MPEEGSIFLYYSEPGAQALSEFASRFVKQPRSVFMSSNNSILAQMRDVILSTDEGIKSFEKGDIEIKPLGEIAKIFSDISDLPARRSASVDEQSVLIAIALQETKLSPRYKEVMHLNGFHNALVNTLSTIRKYQISYDAMSLLKGAISDVSDIAYAFDNVLEKHGYTTLTTRIANLIKSPSLKPKEMQNIFWAGEQEWCPIFISFAKWLRSLGIHLHILLEKHPFIPDFYLQSTFVTNAFPDAKIIEIKTHREGQDPLGKGEWKGFSPRNIKKLLTADNILETEWAIRLGLEKYQPNEMVVFCRSLNDYAHLLYSTASRFGISLKMNQQMPLLTNPFAKLCLNALKACENGNIQHVANIADSGFSGIPPNLREHVVQEIRKCAQADDPWIELHTKATDEENEVPLWFSELVSWREEALTKVYKMADWIRYFNRLIAVMPWLDFSVIADRNSFPRNESAQNAMIRALNLSALKNPNSPMRFRDFVNTAERAWSNTATYERTKGDLKVVTNVSEIGNAQCVIALGMVESTFPARRTEDPILLDKHRLQINELNDNYRLPLSTQIARKERNEFHRLLYASDNLILCAPREKMDQVEIESSYLLELSDSRTDIETIEKTYGQRFPAPTKSLHTHDLLASLNWFASDENIELIESVKQGLNEETKSIYESISRSVANSENEVLNDNQIIYRVSSLPSSMRFAHLRSLRNCPFQYLASAILNIKPRKDAQIWPRLKHVLQDADTSHVKSAEEHFEILKARLKQEISTLRGEYPQDLLDLLSLSGERLLQSFVEREWQARESWGITPVKNNLGLEEAGIRSSFIMNLSTNKSNSETSTRKLKIVLHELVDYLYSYNQKLFPMILDKIPTYNTNDPDSEINDEVFFEIGLLLSLGRDNTNLIPMAMVDDIRAETRQLYVFPGNTQAQNFAQNSKLKVVKKRMGMNEVSRGVWEDTKRLIEKAISGKIRPTPGKHCVYCGYASLCRKSEFAKRFAQLTSEEDE